MELPPSYALFKIISPNDDPKNVGEAILHFSNNGKQNCADRTRICIDDLLLVLQTGPDGKTRVRIGRLSALCWICGHTGLPQNFIDIENALDTNSEHEISPICRNCQSTSTCLVKGEQPDGSTIPFIEKDES